MDQVKAQDEKLVAMAVGIQPLLDCVGLEQPGGALLPIDAPHCSVTDCCRTVWAEFKEFACSATHGAIVHALA